MSAVPNSIHRPIAPDRALVPVSGRPGRAARFALSGGIAIAMAFGLSAGIGGAGVYTLRHHLPWSSAPRPATDAMLGKMHDEIGRLQASVSALRTASENTRSDEALKGLKRSVEAVRQDVEQVRSANAANLAQLSAKIDKVDHDPSPRLAEISTRLDRMEHVARATAEPPAAPTRPIDPSGHAERSEKVAAQPAPLTTGSIPPAAVRVVQAPAAPAAAKPPVPAPVPITAPRAEVSQMPKTVTASGARDLAVAGWVLRDVYDGMALVQSRDGDLREIEPGQFLPGAGEVRAIERRGRAWVVTTSRGVIADATF